MKTRPVNYTGKARDIRLIGRVGRVGQVETMHHEQNTNRRQSRGRVFPGRISKPDQPDHDETLRDAYVTTTRDRQRKQIPLAASGTRGSGIASQRPGRWPGGIGEVIVSLGGSVDQKERLPRARTAAAYSVTHRGLSGRGTHEPIPDPPVIQDGRGGQRRKPHSPGGRTR